MPVWANNHTSVVDGLRCQLPGLPKRASVRILTSAHEVLSSLQDLIADNSRQGLRTLKQMAAKHVGAKTSADAGEDTF